MKKKLFLSALAMCAFMFSMTAQNAPTAKAVPVKKEIKKVKVADATVASTDATPKVKKNKRHHKAKKVAKEGTPN